MNAAGIELLCHYEGFRDRAYLDLVGVCTIGYGFTEGVKPGDTMTHAEARERLACEVAAREDAVRKLCTHAPNDNQLAAMTCLAYNIGTTAFAKSTVLRLHNSGDWAGASGAFRLWNKAGGMVVPGLVRRREAERLLYLA